MFILASLNCSPSLSHHFLVLFSIAVAFANDKFGSALWVCGTFWTYRQMRAFQSYAFCWEGSSALLLQRVWRDVLLLHAHRYLP